MYKEFHNKKITWTGFRWLLHRLFLDGGILWTRSGEQGYRWVYGQVPFATNAIYQRVYIEGVAGDGYQGDIAIDDVIISDGPCPELCK